MSAPAQRWFSAAELAALDLSGYPKTKRGVQHRVMEENWQRAEWENLRWRARQDRGGGVEYHVSILDPINQARVLARFPDPVEQMVAAGRGNPAHSAALWRNWEACTEAQRDEARQRLAAMHCIEDLMGQGLNREQAHAATRTAHGVSRSSLYNWEKLIRTLPRSDWLPALVSASRASARPQEIEPEAWDMLRADYLRPEQPSFDACLRRLQAVAAERGWRLPSARTLRRRIEALPAAVVVKARQGEAALKRMYPAQERSKAHLSALEWVNADGHKFDVFVKWPDGVIDRPIMVAFQDIYSGVFLSWRVDRSEHSDLVRLAYGDMVSVYGIPPNALLDNGRAFASKKITGGIANRYRFKIKPEEPVGIMTQCGTKVHWATPFAGQSKPIERGFRDFATDLAKHPEFAGAYVGNKVTAKPENYQQAAVPLDAFMRVLHQGIIEHNTRSGRRTAVCGGVKSFRQAFEESLQHSVITRATADQERLWLLAAEGVKPRKPDGAIHLMGNRYWHKDIGQWMGKSLVVRFDPQALHENLFVYLPNGRFLFEAEVIEAAGFDNADAARKHARARRAWMRATNEALKIERGMALSEVVKLLPQAEEPAPPERHLIRPVFSGPARAATARALQAEEQSSEEQDLIAGIRRVVPMRPRLVQPEDAAD